MGRFQWLDKHRVVNLLNKRKIQKKVLYYLHDSNYILSSYSESDEIDEFASEINAENRVGCFKNDKGLRISQLAK